MAHIDPCCHWTKKSFVWPVASSLELWNSILGFNAPFHSNATNFGSQQSKKFIKIFPRLPKFDDTPLIINMLRRAIVKLYIQKGNVCCIYELFRMLIAKCVSSFTLLPNSQWSDQLHWIELIYWSQSSSYTVYVHIDCTRWITDNYSWHGWHAQLPF